MPFDPDVFGDQRQPVGRRRVAQQQRDLAALLDRGRCARVEVEDQQIGARLIAASNRHCGTCSSSAARFASRTRSAFDCTTT